MLASIGCNFLSPTVVNRGPFKGRGLSFREVWLTLIGDYSNNNVILSLGTEFKSQLALIYGDNQLSSGNKFQPVPTSVNMNQEMKGE